MVFGFSRSDSTASQPATLYSPAEMQSLFSGLSRSYGKMNGIMSLGLSVWWVKKVLQNVPVTADAKVVDVMCGVGETWGQVLARFPDASLEGVDLSPEMVEVARMRSTEKFGARVKVRHEDVLATSFEDASVDVVVCAYGLKTFDHEQSARLADELVRVLKPGGRFAFVDLTEPPNRFLRAAYDFYLSAVVPAAGRLLLSDPEEYRMLSALRRDYGSGERSWEALGLHPNLVVERTSHLFGCAVSFHGQRVR